MYRSEQGCFGHGAEYIIGCRLVKLVQDVCEQLVLLVSALLTKQDLTQEEPIILALDTSSKVTSLAVARGVGLLGSSHGSLDERRSEKLWIDVQSLLAEMELGIGDIDVFAVCIGPGGFTGLRVGMAAMKGFSASTSKPIVGVTSLEAAAFSVGPAIAVCAMVNAYKGDVYSQLFSFDDDGVPVAQNHPSVGVVEDAVQRAAAINEVVFVGDGAEDGNEVIRRIGESGNKQWAIKQRDSYLATAVAGLAFLRNRRGELESAESVTACYVRQAEVEIKLSLGLLGSKIKRSMRGE